MAADRIIINSLKNEVISQNGYYRVLTTTGRRSHYLLIDWVSDQVEPAGSLTLSYNGDYGTVLGVLNLATQAAIGSTIGLDYIDIDVTNLPAGGSFVPKFG